jgi:glutathione-specific gamma-glutamylcyclotransferase
MALHFSESALELNETQHTSSPTKVWGAAYRIPSEHVKEVQEYLDIREINGYSMQFVPFHRDHSAEHKRPSATLEDDLPIPDQPRCLVYIGLPDNPQFLGPQDPQALAEHIVRSRGPSGENKDYLYELEAALNSLSEESGDEHISDLARRCREVELRSKHSD